MNIRPVTVEFLRKGPRHNQLLSPLTDYLAICGDSPAGVVNVPYEQAVFERQLSELRYGVHDKEDPERRQGVLDETGRDIGTMLASVPGLPGSLSSQRESELLHLRIILSASELALLPFELAKVPIAPGISSDQWLLLQPQPPVCVTRHIRSVRSDRVQWPAKPKILFISGDNVPFNEHRAALSRAVQPWCGGQEEKEWITALENPDIQRIMAEIAAQEFTHVHILAHGAPSEGKHDRFSVSIGDLLYSGKELANALLKVTADHTHSPTVVTLAVCDSGNQGSPAIPGASVAHDLHEAGIPLVIGSQFPLSVAASTPFIESFYSDQMWGVHPLVSLYRIRFALHALNNRNYHDWASLVIYEALPPNLDQQLADVRYWQSRRVLERSLTCFENASREMLRPVTRELYRQLDKDLRESREKLPKFGPYQAECSGLRAASWKRRAEIEFRLAGASDSAARSGHARECYLNLENALRDYRDATKAFLIGNDQAVQRKATLHWLLAQVISMECVLGHPFREDAWRAAMFSAESELEMAGQEAKQWAHGTLAELSLLRLADQALDDNGARAAAAEAVRHAQMLVELNGLISEQVRSTHRQFERYVNWWSQPGFWELMRPFGMEPKPHWRKKDGLVETAQRVIEILGGDIHHAPAGGSSDEGAPATENTNPDAPPAPAAETLGRETPVTGPRSTRSGAMFHIEMLPADHGDCLWIEYGENSRVIIDCGSESAARILSDRTRAIRPLPAKLDLFVLTHIDSDHISGALPFFEGLRDEIGFHKIWFNGWKQLPKDKLGVEQGEEFSELLGRPRLRPFWNHGFSSDNQVPGAVVVPAKGDLPSFKLPGGMQVTVLSPGERQLAALASKWLEGLLELHPDKEASDFLAGKRPEKIRDYAGLDVRALADKKPSRDSSPANGSSIALLMEFEGKAALLAGDAHADVIASSIARLMKQRKHEGSRLRLDALKLSHHGSRNALTRPLLDSIECHRYLVSTNGAQFYHPDREAIARILMYGGAVPELYFNYKTELNEIWGHPTLIERFGHRAFYPSEGDAGMKVEV